MSYHESNDLTVDTQARKRSRNDAPGRANTLDVGFQSFQATYDGTNVQTEMGAGASILPQVTLAAHSMTKGDGLFAFENAASQPVPYVRHLFNELLAPFAEIYPDDPEMMMFALEQTIRPLGSASENMAVSQNDLNPSIGVKYMGIENIAAIGSVHCGKRMLWRLDRFGSSLTANQAGSDGHSQKGASYGLHLAPFNEQTVGTMFNKACAELTTNSKTWEMALAGFPGKAAPWTAAAMANLRHVETGVIIAIEKLLRAGILNVNTNVAGSQVSNVEGDAAGNIRVPDELLGARNAAGGYAQLESHEVAARIANFIGLTAPSNTLVGTLSSDAFRFYAEFGHRFAESMYYGASAHTASKEEEASVNGFAEFGATFAANGPKFHGRNRDGSIKEDRVGSVVQLQIYSTQQASSAYAHAMDYMDKWMAGTCIAGSANGKAVVMLHK